MKNHWAGELRDGQAVLSLFLVAEKTSRTKKNGDAYLELLLSDKTGKIRAVVWDNVTAFARVFESDDIVQVRGTAKLSAYSGQVELTLEDISAARDGSYDLADFLPHTKHDVEKLYAELRSAVVNVKNPWLARLLASVVEDPAIAPKLKRAPAAMTMHHAFVGGLLEHVVSLTGLGRAVAAHYPELDPDLLLAGIVLHDIGKIDELRYARGFDYSTAGRLLGHIVIGIGIVREKIKAIPDFPAELALVIEHLIASHHGSLEFGSPALPRTREALALHFVDDLDSKMAAVRGTLDKTPADGALFSERVRALGREFLRSDKFLPEASTPAEARANMARTPAAAAAPAGAAPGVQPRAAAPTQTSFPGTRKPVQTP